MDTVQGPHMSCSYDDIAIESFDENALKYHPSVIGWKRFWDDAFSLTTFQRRS